MCSGNIFRNNIIEDCDGFGIYFQVGGNDSALGNKIVGNDLKNVCLSGVQMTSLPFAAIGITGGSDTSVIDNRIDGTGAVGFEAPGIRVDFPLKNLGEPSGVITGTNVTRGQGHGFDLRSSNWTLTGCGATDNSGSGFRVFSDQEGARIENVSFIDCAAVANRGAGFLIDSSQVSNAGGAMADILGGSASDNGAGGVKFAGNTAGGLISGVTIAPF
jgi:hypothetical protein